MTAAVADALLHFDAVDDDDAFIAQVVDSMHSIGRHYPTCGYGGRFLRWMYDDEALPYNSYGNGSAMRVSPVAWYASTLEEAEHLAELTAAVSHNHPEGIRGAVCTAGAQFLAKTGHSKEEICAYVLTHYPHAFDLTVDETRETYHFNETCQGTVPQAMLAFKEAESFEDAIRTAVSIGGDSDTMAAITGAVAEAFWGIPTSMALQGRSFLDTRLKKITDTFRMKWVVK